MAQFALSMQGLFVCGLIHKKQHLIFGYYVQFEVEETFYLF